MSRHLKQIYTAKPSRCVFFYNVNLLQSSYTKLTNKLNLTKRRTTTITLKPVDIVISSQKTEILTTVLTL